MREPKPHVVGFVAGMMLLAGISTAADRVTNGTTTPGVVVDQAAAGLDEAPDDGSTPTPTPTGTGAEPATDGRSVEGTSTPGTSGTGTSTTSAGSGTSTGSVGTSGGSGGTGTTSGGQTGSGGAPPAASPQPPAGGGSQPAPTPPPGGGGSSPSPSPSAAPPAQPAAPAWPEANLYDDSEKVRGITDGEIVLCGHAALALGAAFDTSREDLNVYWDMVNEAGGIHGRQVRMTWEDDAYLSSEAVRAATTCSDKDPFMILGGIGFDQIPGVRDWAEANRELYLHHIAVAPTQDYGYSFSLSPTVQLVGTEFGNHILRKHAGKKVGVMYRNTDNWKPGSDAGTAVLQAAGTDVTSYPLTQNQGVYAQELNQMKVAGVEVVWIWENALIAAQILNQADEIDYFPTFVVFPFQQTIDILNDPAAFTIEGVASWGAYAPGGYDGAHAEYGVDPEIARFEATYAQHRPETTPNDILWQVWGGNMILHQMLLDCGASCNRNSFAGMMMSGYRTQVNPTCQVDFADSRSFGGHHGGFRFFSQELVDHRSGRRYATRDYCVTTLG